MIERGQWNGYTAIVVRRQEDNVVLQIESAASPRGRSTARILIVKESAWRKANGKA